MALLADYTAGTISVSANGTAVTGVGTAWQTAMFKEGDWFIANGWVNVVASVNSETSLTLAQPWRGGALTNATYRLRYMSDGSRASAQARQLIDMLSGTGNLEAIAGLAGAAGLIPVFTGAGTMEVRPYAAFSGSYDDLTGKPTLGTAAATDATAYATASQGLLADSAVQPSDLADVATSGDYDDLVNKPTLGTMAAEDASDYAKVADLGDAAFLDVGATAGTVAAGDDGRITGAVQKDADGSLTAGYTATAVDDGTKSSGTYTPTPAGGNIRKIVNGGAFTLAAPSASGDYTLIIQITNNSSAGAITMSGFSKSGGDSFTTTDGDDFLVYIAKANGFTHAQVVALQ